MKTLKLNDIPFVNAPNSDNIALKLSLEFIVWCHFIFFCIAILLHSWISAASKHCDLLHRYDISTVDLTVNRIQRKQMWGLRIIRMKHIFSRVYLENR